MNNILLQSLDYYFIKSNASVNLKNGILTNNIINNMPVITFNNITKNYNYLGMYNYNNKKFIWSWHMNIEKFKYVKSKQLIFYAINKEVKTLEDTYIKTLLTSSINHVNQYDDVVQIIALALYLTKADDIFVQKDGDLYNFYGLYDLDNDTK